jgi:hypothetical protein
LFQKVIFLNKNKNKGFIPFGEIYFSITKVNEFINYLNDLIKEKKTDENELLKIIQNLSLTITYILKNNQNKKLVDKIIQNYCDMFNNTCLDPSFVNFILTESIDKEIEGKALIFSEYKATLNDLYKQAQNLLSKNTKNAIKIKNKFITFPFENSIIMGYENMVNEENILSKTKFPNSSIKINDLIIPVLPFELNELSKINEQCLRQFIRAIISNHYSLSPLDDLIIFIVMGFMLKVNLSNINDVSIKNYFKDITTIMLKKKLKNCDQTELERIQSGELPLPFDGKVQAFYNNMNKVQSILNLKNKYKPCTFWYILCLAYNDTSILNKQIIHCKDSINEDFKNLKDFDKDLLENFKNNNDELKLKLIEIDVFYNFDYICMVTQENIEKEGGYSIKKHSNCTPNFVFSKIGYQKILENPFCPICFQKITKNDFYNVNPKKNYNFNDLFQNNKNIYKNDIEINDKNEIKININKKNNDKKNNNDNNDKKNDNNDKKNINININIKIDDKNKTDDKINDDEEEYNDIEVLFEKWNLNHNK